MKIQNLTPPISWQAARTAAPLNKGHLFSDLLADQLSRPQNAIKETGGAPESSRPWVVGTVTPKTPTVSQLLYKSPLKADCWNIIHDKVNAHKAFHKIRPGTQVVFDPDSRELLWGKRLKAFMAARSPDKEAGTSLAELNPAPAQNLSHDPAPLSNAVKTFIGRDYQAMDCYELVVGGLKELGVKYRGAGGLGRHLMNQAREKGLPENHYLNGEGLVSESGRPVFKKTLFRVNHPESQAQAIMEEMKDLLREGQLLSFSTRDKGHTGVVSRARDQWTFINSGDMDHNISGPNGAKAVGEEDLRSELENWLLLAKDARQGLKITLGELNINRLSMFRPERGRVNKKA